MRLYFYNLWEHLTKSSRPALTVGPASPDGASQQPPPEVKEEGKVELENNTPKRSFRCSRTGKICTIIIFVIIAVVLAISLGCRYDIKATTIKQQPFEEGNFYYYNKYDSVYMVLGGELRRVPDKVLAKIFVNKEHLNPRSLPSGFEPVFGRALPDDAILFQGVSPGPAYLLDVDPKNSDARIKRWIFDPYTFNMYSFNWGAIQSKSIMDADAIPLGDTIASLFTDDGLIVGSFYRNNTDGAIYTVLDGKLRHIPNPRVYARLYANIPMPWMDLEAPANAHLVSKIGIPLSLEADLIKGQSTDEVYLVDQPAVEGGRLVKRWIINPRHFDVMHFGRIRVVSQRELDYYPTSNNI
eukprot:TRINITY_DN11716_c0_g1_i1.p1 TRINITY_DN11716_c0_g1~~TRINITY_DN11716_c0_g1_i1.p1  ORF type:complete len:354 (+),score=37.67 TRINITY_DN11716_c0_g1_i1:290-1351(+)